MCTYRSVGEYLAVPYVLPSASLTISTSWSSLKNSLVSALVATAMVSRSHCSPHNPHRRLTTPFVDVGLQAGAVIGLPPVLNFGSPEMKAKVVPEVLSGKKFICLAISEAFAGSDVMGLQTTAKKSEDGKNWIINGTKKWITNGTFAD